ncbi:uncharacterized protein LOC117322519 isoform X2 [Pecten maximus]|uniref:uncharacterized protein LOC117322519 isoform X2 n=1 Tax=Pecten maximus TaxID=6579 RepID=UPI001458960D|nr:uncharacterized protein LOC117322519 isoform X2 [Pecten maximus]
MAASHLHSRAPTPPQLSGDALSGTDRHGAALPSAREEPRSRPDQQTTSTLLTIPQPCLSVSRNRSGKMPTLSRLHLRRR